jgi:hypothetical protein
MTQARNLSILADNVNSSDQVFLTAGVSSTLGHGCIVAKALIIMLINFIKD